MAKDVSGPVWKFDATGQAEGFANAAVAGVEFTLAPIFVRSIKILTDAAGGAAIVKESSGGRTIVETPTLDPETTYEEGVDAFFRGVYIDTLPAGATVWVKHGLPNSRDAAPGWSFP